MAGLSLECGDCKAQLRSVEEAQEHAEVTGHANFQESTQAVLNLVCTTCGKPCRTQTEQDLHTKRTGHADFADKTAEAAKPIVLETKPAAGPSGSGAEGSSASAPEMTVPEVNKEALAELEAMGFPVARSTRALHFSGSTNVETAVNWIVEHENDPDIDEMPLVAADSNTSIQSLLTPEEAKAKAQELVLRAKRKKEEEERRMEKERERERIRIGKELQEARRIEEQQERQRIIAFRKAEKDEEQRARLKIRQKVEEDKAERRRKLGLPAEEPKAAEAAPPPQEEKKPFVPLRPASKAEQMRECLRGLKHAHKDEDARVKKAFQTMLTYVGNVAQNPNEEKYRKIRLTNAAFQERVGSLKGGVEFLQLCGFERDESEFLFLPMEKVDSMLLNVAGSELTSAISNPFFGVL